MTIAEQASATNRMRRALLAFQTAKIAFLIARRRFKALPEAEVNQLKATLRLTATEVDAAFKMFSAAGLVTDDKDQRSITEAQRYLAESKP
ncbi:hypothetical protein JMJ55_29390 [Belnapia sp. T6]|uniref:Uncharacterized protein n=1 Tax=Belnapia mucosa TaxID=2804532 RepID=A0ABS1VCU9_9PROT|nr:hypothetical protein [Belnapia mucosa]MBL6459432.1 hypothetical protein [Belnapia mucosa]